MGLIWEVNEKQGWKMTIGILAWITMWMEVQMIDYEDDWAIADTLEGANQESVWLILSVRCLWDRQVGENDDVILNMWVELIRKVWVGDTNLEFIGINMVCKSRELTQWPLCTPRNERRKNGLGPEDHRVWRSLRYAGTSSNTEKGWLWYHES